MFKMKKGAVGPIIVGMIVITLIVVGLITAFATNAAQGGLATKHLFEASLISESDRVETFARSFLRATDLSLIQSMHNLGNSEVIMPYDLDANYNSKYNLPVWQISSETGNQVFIPPTKILYNKFRQGISWTTSCYLDNYFESYSNFAKEEDFSFSEKPLTRVDILSDDKIRIQADENVILYKITYAEDKKIEIDRSFKPFSEILSKYGNTLNRTYELIDDDKIGKCVRNDTTSFPVCYHDKTNRGDTQNALNRLASSLSTSDVEYIFEILEFKTFGSEGEAVINVSIFDNTTNYSVYSMSGDIVVIDYPGVEFLVIVYRSGDGAWANGQYEDVSNFADQCPSDINLVSAKTTPEICQYFDVSPTTCTDPGDDTDLKETCEDFTGSYEDTCVVNYLYQYSCHSSDICQYNDPVVCGVCDDGACLPAEICDDTIDNDGDGDIDCDDPDCVGDPACNCPPQVCQNLFNLVNTKQGSSCTNLEGFTADPADDYDPVADVNKDEIIDVVDSIVVGLNGCGGGGVWCQDRFVDTSSPCTVDNELWVNFNDSEFDRWLIHLGTAPWLNDSDDKIYSNMEGDTAGAFHFEDYTGSEAINSVKLNVQIYWNKNWTAFIWDNSEGKWVDLEWLEESGTATEITWVERDITSYIDSLDDVNNLKIYFKKGLSTPATYWSHIIRVKVVIDYVTCNEATGGDCAPALNCLSMPGWNCVANVYECDPSPPNPQCCCVAT